MKNEEIQNHIERNCRHEDGTPAMDEQAFYEGAKWMRDQSLCLDSLHRQILEVIMENGFLVKQESWDEEQMEIRAIYDSFRIINLVKDHQNNYH